MPYGKSFYDTINAGSRSSAEIVVPFVLDVIDGAKSVVDIGCGEGAWTAVFAEHGCDVLGIDGPHVDRSRLQIPAERFTALDIQHQRVTGVRAELAVSLEVAEHLSSSRAMTFIEDLCAAADIVLFSAAIPGQGGVGHCFPEGTVVSGPAATSSYSRSYQGEFIKLAFASGDFLTVTPNHPVLTSKGWVAAGLLQVGDDVVRCLDAQGATVRVPGDYQVPAPIEDVAAALDVVGGSRAVPTSAEDFHGDGRGSEVTVVRTHGLLGRGGHSEFVQPGCELVFSGASMGSDSLAGKRLLGEGLGASRLSAHSLDQGVDDVLSGFRASASGSDLVHLCSPSGLDAGIGQSSPHGRATDAEAGCQLIRGLAGLVERDEIVAVGRFEGHGDVFNLGTEPGWYVANGVIAHNCNEQWPEYWVELFSHFGRIVTGALRWAIWDDARAGRVENWYAQNLLLAVTPEALEERPTMTPWFEAPMARPYGVVHPVLWDSRR